MVVSLLLLLSSLASDEATPACGVDIGSDALRAADEDAWLRERPSVTEDYRAAARDRKPGRADPMDKIKARLAAPNCDDDCRSAVLVDLAELYLGEGRDLYLTELQRFEDDCARCQEQPGCTDVAPVDHHVSGICLEKAVRLASSTAPRNPPVTTAQAACLVEARAQALLNIPAESLCKAPP